MIPHKIHYCWFGHNPKPKLILKCIDSWRKYCPDWEIIEWNEENYDVYGNEYTKNAYENKKWAYVSDFARFDILNRYGGVYFDTDVELLRPIPSYLLEGEAFTGLETPEKVAPGLVYGTIADHSFLREVLEKYRNIEFSTEETVVDIISQLFAEDGFVGDNTEQTIKGVRIMPTEFFGCFNHEIQEFEITNKTISIHHYYASWQPWYMKMRFRAIKLAAKILGKDRYLRMKGRIKR